MKTIVIDDELYMLRKFERFSESIHDIELIGSFDDGKEAIEFAQAHKVELAFIDINLPTMDGIEVARRLRKIREDMIIVFLTAYDNYIKEFNEVGGDYYILKPYSKVTLEQTMEKMKLLHRRQEKPIYIQTFGRFLVLKDNKAVQLSGKAKEILALIVIQRGKEISNEEIFSTIWEDKPYSNANMTVLYNAIKRLKDTLKKEQMEDLLISTGRGKRINTDLFDCDYYSWQDKEDDDRVLFDGSFLQEYSWGEYYLAKLLKNTSKSI